MLISNVYLETVITITQTGRSFIEAHEMSSWQFRSKFEALSRGIKVDVRKQHDLFRTYLYVNGNSVRIIKATPRVSINTAIVKKTLNVFYP